MAKDLKGIIDELLIIDVFYALILDEKGNMICMDRLKQADVSASVDGVEITGGRRQQLIANVGGKKTLTVTTSEPMFRLDALAMSLGEDIKTGASVAYAMPKVYDVSDKSVDLEHTPLSKDSIIAYGEDGVKIEGTDIALLEKKITFTEYSGKKVKVTYQYNTPETTHTLNISSSNFPKAKRLILETIVIDKDENPVALFQLDFPSAKPNGSFNLSTSESVDAVANEIEWAITDNGGSLGTVRLIPIEDAVPVMMKKEDDLVL